MSTVNARDLQRDPLAHLRRAEAGTSILVARGGLPVVELRPMPKSRSPIRPFGLAAGAFTVPADFDAPLPDEILREF